MKILRLASKPLVIIFTIGMTIACTVFNTSAPAPGITYVASRGNPRANSIVWSPQDSTKILVSAIGFPKNDSQVYVLDITSKKKAVLIGTDYSGVVGEGWSPDGKQIVLSVAVAERRFPQSGLWTVNTEDGSMELLSVKVDAVAWLPDGNTLGIMTLDLGFTQNPRQVSIYLMDIETKVSKLVYSNQKAITFSGFSSSPDGERLIFSLNSDYYSSQSDLYILDVPTGTVRQITHDGASSGPEWSPKNDLITYVKSHKVGDNATHSLHILLPDGSCDLEIPNTGEAYSPTWSPDGSRIAFIGEDGVYVLNVEKVFGRDIFKNLCP